MKARRLGHFGVASIALVGTLLIGIRQGATNQFPTPLLREIRLRAERLIYPSAMFVGDGAALAAYDAGFDGKADVVVIGDSLVARGKWNELFPDIAIHARGIDGDTVTGVHARLGQVTAKSPDIVVLMVGLNDVVAGNRTADIARVYDAVLAGLPRDASVVVTSILPCCSEATIARTARLNRALRGIAARRRATFVDLAAEIAPTGRIGRNYTIDGVHLTAAGYKRWRDALAPFIGRGIDGRCNASNQDQATPRTTEPC